MDDYDGVRRSGKAIMARLMSEAITKGEVIFPNGTKMRIGAKEWLDVFFKALNQVDGPPKLEVDLSDSKLEIVVTYENKPDTPGTA
jgi:hypothetical protein